MLASFEVAGELPAGALAVRLVAEGPAPFTAATSLPEHLAASRGFRGKEGDSLVLEGPSGFEALVGVGPAGDFGLPEARRAGATAVRARGTERAIAIDLRGVVSGEPARLAQAVTEGAVGASYRFEAYKSSRESNDLERVVLVVGEGEQAATEEGIGWGRAIAEAVNFARDLSNRAPTDLTPSEFARMASELAGSTGLVAEVMEKDRIVAERLGGLLGVGRGSDEDPRLVRLSYEPDASVARSGPDGRLPTVVLVGKGITFDSGGLSLKPPEGMIGMKGDMGGAAAVVAAISACRALKVGVRVVAIAPTTENMPSGKAIKPGDVLKIRNGKTIEVLNTDAEGRLVLADGLSLAVEEEPDAIVDVATLTGAVVVALGRKVAGVMGNDSAVVGGIEAASERAGEPFWRLPLPRAYRKEIDSEIADIKNVGRARQAGSLIAGLVLEEFVSDRPWAHLDIAGVSETEEDAFEYRRGATAFGVRTLVEFLRGFEAVGEAGRLADHVKVG